MEKSEQNAAKHWNLVVPAKRGTELAIYIEARLSPLATFQDYENMKIPLALLLAGLLGLAGTSTLQAQHHGHHGGWSAGNAHGYNYGHSGAHQRSYGSYSHNFYAPSYGATHLHASRPYYAQPYQSYYAQPYQSYYAPGQVYQAAPSHYDYHAPSVQRHRLHRDVTPGHYDVH